MFNFANVRVLKGRALGHTNMRDTIEWRSTLLKCFWPGPGNLAADTCGKRAMETKREDGHQNSVCVCFIRVGISTFKPLGSVKSQGTPTPTL